MQRSACLLTLMSLVTLGACGDSGKSTGDPSSESESMTQNPSGISISVSETNSESDSDTNTTSTDPSESESATVPTTGSESDGTTENTTFDPNDCGEAVVDIPIVTPSVMLVLDKSGSMVTAPNGLWDHDANPDTPDVTRWNSLYSVVDFIVNSFNNSMNLGAVLFPSKAAQSSYTEAACLVGDTPEVPVGQMNAAAILAAIPGPNEVSGIKGGTPATRGMLVALEDLEAVQGDQPKFVILVTDGAANCSPSAVENEELFEVYDAELATTVAGAFAMGIPTYVVGIAITNVTSGATQDGNPDNTNTFDELNTLAEIGGVPREGEVKFYDTQDENELKAALEAISMQILSCTIELNPVPKYPDYVEVEVAGVEYGTTQVTDCATESGWQFTDESMTAIELCGQACADFQLSGSLDAQYRCPNSG